MSIDPYTPFNDRLDEIINETPERAAAVAEMMAEVDEERRVYRMNLATIRKAAELTQADIAGRLGTTQSAVSRAEQRGDMLYSTLLAYLRAAGAHDATLTVTVGGRRVEVLLSDAAKEQG
ncbi:MAG: helix-turn-helix transcriptional regulator [Micrococcales bacterium]|nr:helix-turn-helix transcriptional regulator [Micrococcales bacterium]